MDKTARLRMFSARICKDSQPKKEYNGKSTKIMSLVLVVKIDRRMEYEKLLEKVLASLSPLSPSHGSLG